MGPPGPQGPPLTGEITGTLSITSGAVPAGLFVGVANPAQRNAGLDGSNSTTWVAEHMLYYDLFSLASFYPPPGLPLGIVAAVRTSDNMFLNPTDNAANIAIASYNVSDGSGTYPGFSWGFYGSSRVQQYAGTAIGCELSMGNLGPGTPEVNPYQGLGNGAGVGLWLSSGSEAYAEGQTVYPASAAIGVVSNGSTWAKGIVFMNDGLLKDGNGIMKAAQLPRKAEIEWTFDSSGSRSSFIRGDGTSSTGGMGISFQEGSFNVVDTATETSRLSVTPAGKTSLSGGLSFGQRQTATATDVTQHISLFDGFGGFAVSGGYINLVASNTVVATTSGADFRVSVPLLVFGNVGFYGRTPVSQQIVTGAKGGNTALASLIAALVALNLIGDTTTA